MSDQQQLKRIIEAAILAANEPLSVDRLSKLFAEQEAPTNAEIREALKTVAEDCEGRGFELKEVASGFRFQVSQDLSPWVGRLWEEKPQRYSRALLETLSLIAYRQPTTRGEIEEVRGVAVSSNIIRTLLEREWIRVVGHRDVPGKPAMYATTREFLDYFNLKSLGDLPTLAEIKDLDKLNEELQLEPQPEIPDSLELPEEGLELPDENLESGEEGAESSEKTVELPEVAEKAAEKVAEDEATAAELAEQETVLADEVFEAGESAFEAEASEDVGGEDAATETEEKRAVAELEAGSGSDDTPLQV